MGRSCGRPYNRTCGMNRPQPVDRKMNDQGCSCKNRENETRENCNCIMPGSSGKSHEMFSHLQHLEPAMAYVPCQEFIENYPLQYALNVGTVFHSYVSHFAERGVLADEAELFKATDVRTN